MTADDLSKTREVPKEEADEAVSKPVEGMDEDEEMALALQNYVPDTIEEKRLVRKVDLILLPCLWWMYVLAYLDRGNIVSPAQTTSNTCTR